MIRIAALTAALSVPFSLLSQAPLPETPPDAAATDENDQPPLEETLRKAIEDLSSDDFPTREAAQFRLWQAGRDGEKALAAALAETTDAETRMRARRVLAEFAFGIYPDTPADVIALIRQFRAGDIDERQMAIAQLTEKADFSLIFKLMSTVEDRDQREMLSRVVARHTEELVRQKIMEDDLDEAERILRISAVVPDAMQNFAAFCHLRGRSEIVMKEMETANLPEEVRLEIRHWLARISGDYATALQLAEQMGDAVLIREIQVLQGDMAAYCRGAVDFNTRTIRVLAHKAALARHTGDTTAFSACIEDILKYSTEFPGEADSIYEALVANGRADEGLEVARINEPRTAFNHLIRQERYEEAMAVLGIDKLMPPYDDWLEKACGEIAKAEDSSAAYKAFLEPYNVARFLVTHGLQKEAEAILAKAADSLGDNRLGLSTNLCYIFRVLDMRELLFAHADRVLQMGADFEDVVADVFLRAQNETAMHWATRFPDELAKDKSKLIRRLADILLPDGSKVPPEVDELLAETETWLKENPEEANKPAPVPAPNNPIRRPQFRGAADPFGPAQTGRDWHRTLGETYAVLERYADAERHYSQCTDADINGSTFLYSADYAAMGKQWQRASEFYHKAWEEDDSSELNLFLSGWALHRAGGDSKAEGERIMQKARLLMLASPNRNSEVARMLWEQGDTELAIPIARLVLRVTDPNDAESIRQSEYLSQYLRYTDQEKEAANLQERVMLYLVSRKSSSTPLVSRSWIDVLEARAALRAGDKDAAMEKIESALTLTPGDSSALEDFHPMLVERGFQAEADAIFDRAYPISRRTAELFDNYDQGHNNHAWLLARCRRNLDEALKHAQKALEIDPDSAATTDTLAEVWFARGDFAKAVEVSDKAVEITPTDAQLRKQNQRFREALEKSQDRQ